jgi:hypothetical protein
MELLDRYLQAVKKHLPWERQDDIVAELKANLEAQLEDKEAELGRPLTKEEMEAWIQQLGSPLLVAARYGPQRHLIGPALFPIYWYLLRLVIGWTTLIYLIAKTVEIGAKGLSGHAVLDAALRLPGIWLINAAVVTLIFAVVEAAGARFPGRYIPFAPMSPVWLPAALPPLAKSAGERPRSFAKALAEVIFGWLLLAWLLLVPRHPYLLLGPGAWVLASLPYKLAPVWWPYYWMLVAIQVFELAWSSWELARGTWQRPRRVRPLITHTMGLASLAILLSAPDHALFLLKNPAADAAAHGAALASLNKGLTGALALAAAIVALQLVWSVGKMGAETYRKRRAAQ